MYSAVSLVEVYTVYTYTMRFTSWYTVVVPNFSIARIVRKFVCSRKVILIFMSVSLAGSGAFTRRQKALQSTGARRVACLLASCKRTIRIDSGII